MSNRYSDENFLHMFFHQYLSRMYKDHGLLADGFYQNAVCDGFELPLDPDYLAPFMYDLADRLAYKLVDNMWVDK